MATYSFPCDCGQGTCSYDLESQQSALVAMGGELSVVSSSVALGLIGQSAPDAREGQSMRLPSGTTYDELISFFQEPWTMTDEDKLRVFEAGSRLAVQGDGVIVYCSCRCVYVLPIEAEPVT